MTQVSSSTPNSLPGIVTDQPEIYEYDPAPSDDTGINDLDLLNEPTDEAIALIEVPVKQAFSYFAERENEIAKFYVQRFGEYKISGDKPEDESDLEKYHRLVSEVNELLSKFQSESLSKSEMTTTGALGGTALTNNLEVLSKQLKSLEIIKEGGAEFQSLKSRLDNLGKKILNNDEEEQTTSQDASTDETSKLIRMSALERRLNLLETLLGFNEAKAQSLFNTTKCESIIEATETLSSWLANLDANGIQRVNREIDVMSQRLEKINEQVESESPDKLDSQAKSKLDQLYNLLTSSGKHLAMLPTIISRLRAMEELQQKAASVVETVAVLEDVQSQIAESFNTNKDALSDLNEMFNKNIELIKEYSADIDSRIASIRDKDE